MEWLWTWSGKFFGYFDGKDLWTYDGKHVGKLRDEQIYDHFGRYLGEVMNDNRLITDDDRAAWTNFTFIPHDSHEGHSKQEDKPGNESLNGYSDFRGPDEFE